MRGKVKPVPGKARQNGITPAYAGKSPAAGGSYGQRRDHPRLCGEKLNIYTSAMKAYGSPPPMRGKAVAYAPKAFTPGITPAYAGKRHPLRHTTLTTKDHPRLCGEKVQSFAFCP